MTKEIKNIVQQLLEEIKEMSDGSVTCTSWLMQDLNCDQLFFKERLEIHDALLKAAEAEGFRLKMHHNGTEAEMPFDQPFLIRYDAERTDRKEIAEITVSGSSGSVPDENAYRDRMTIRPDSFSYECAPVILGGNIRARNCSYHTTTLEYWAQFVFLADQVEELLDMDAEWPADTGECTFTVTYEDQTCRTKSVLPDSSALRAIDCALSEIMPAVERFPEFLVLMQHAVK